MDREQRVRERAYLLWDQEGRPSGREQEHWERAVRDLSKEEAVSRLPDEAVAGDTPPPPQSGNVAPAVEEPTPLPQTASLNRAGKTAAKKPHARGSKNKAGKTVA
jgi:hypothetical protein